MYTPGYGWAPITNVQQSVIPPAPPILEGRIYIEKQLITLIPTGRVFLIEQLHSLTGPVQGCSPFLLTSPVKIL